LLSHTILALVSSFSLSLCFLCFFSSFLFDFFDEKKFEEKLSFSSLGIWFCRQGGLADGGFCREHSGRIVIIQRSLLEGSGFADNFFFRGFLCREQSWMDIIAQLQEQASKIAYLAFNTVGTLQRDAPPAQLSADYPNPPAVPAETVAAVAEQPKVMAAALVQAVKQVFLGLFSSFRQYSVMGEDSQRRVA
jgi:hypothetical protein